MVSIVIFLIGIGFLFRTVFQNNYYFFVILLVFLITIGCWMKVNGYDEPSLMTTGSSFLDILISAVGCGIHDIISYILKPKKTNNEFKD